MLNNVLKEIERYRVIIGMSLEITMARRVETRIVMAANVMAGNFHRTTFLFSRKQHDIVTLLDACDCDVT